MPDISAVRRPIPGRFGVQVIQTGAQVGSSGLDLTATATVSLHVPIPRRKCKLLALNVVQTVAGAGAGTLTMQPVRRNSAGAGSDINLTAAYDLKTTAGTTNAAVAITATGPQTIFQAGDALRLDLAAQTTVTTQPRVCVSAEFAVLD